jgi:CheY-like chemotaxis protein
VPLAPGQIIEDVRIERALREDPAGTVYEGSIIADASDGPDEKVTLLVIAAQDVRAAPLVRARLRRAAMGASACLHPGIERVREVGELPDGCIYVLGDAAPGETLARRLASGPLGPDEAACAGLLLAQALAAAHRGGVVHRDLLPERVLLHGAGAALSVLVLGFGLSRVVPARPSPYRPPEAATLRDEELDGRCDQFALGRLLREMGAEGVVARHAARACAPRREDRFPSMAAFAQALLPAPSPVLSSAPAAAAAPGPGRAVLVVDGDEDSACAVRDILASRGYRCGCAADGAGLTGEALRAQGIGLVILDLALPGEPGDAICRRIKEGGGGVKVVLLSALAGGAQRALAAGPDAYLDKPFEMAELLAEVERLLV